MTLVAWAVDRAESRSSRGGPPGVVVSLSSTRIDRSRVRVAPRWDVICRRKRRRIPDRGTGIAPGSSLYCLAVDGLSIRRSPPSDVEKKGRIWTPGMFPGTLRLFLGSRVFAPERRRRRTGRSRGLPAMVRVAPQIAQSRRETPRSEPPSLAARLARTGPVGGNVEGRLMRRPRSPLVREGESSPKSQAILHGPALADHAACGRDRSRLSPRPI